MILNSMYGSSGGSSSSSSQFKQICNITTTEAMTAISGSYPSFEFTETIDLKSIAELIVEISGGVEIGTANNAGTKSSTIYALSDVYLADIRTPEYNVYGNFLHFIRIYRTGGKNFFESYTHDKTQEEHYACGGFGASYGTTTISGIQLYNYYGVQLYSGTKVEAYYR